jgi:hypothetical protein
MMNKRQQQQVLVAVISLVVIFVALFLIMFTVQRNNQITRENEANSTPSTQTLTVKPEETDEDRAKQIEDYVLEHYGVAEFGEILNQNKASVDSLAGVIADITEIKPTNPGSNDGEYTILFNRIWSTVSQTIAHNVADEVMRIAGPQMPSLQGITAEFRTYDGVPYYTEKADRTVL